MSDDIKQNKEKIEALLKEQAITLDELFRRMSPLLELVHHVYPTYTKENPIYLNYYNQDTTLSEIDKKIINFTNEARNLSRFSVASILEDKKSSTPKPS